MDDFRRRYYLLMNRGDTSILTVPEEIDHTINHETDCCKVARARAHHTTNPLVIVPGSGLMFAYDDIPCDCGCHTF